MIKDNLTTLILQARKEHNKSKLEALQAIKAEFQKHETAKGATPLDEAKEITILKKMIEQRQITAKLYSDNSRPDLAEKELAEVTAIEDLGFIPKPATEHDIACVFDAITTLELEPVKQNMGKIVKAIKQALPNADGKMVATYVSSNLH